MSRIVNVAAAQVGAIERSASRAEVVERLIAMMREAHRRGSDVVIFPELALTTFFPRWFMEDQAEVDSFFEREMPSAQTQPLFDEAKRLGIAFVLGYAELTPEGRHYNTAIWVDKTGQIVHKYRKVHLPGHREHEPWRAFQHLEKRYFDVPGVEEGFRVARAHGGIVGLLICNDRRWPESYRSLGLQGVELIAIGYTTPIHNPPSPEHDRHSWFHNELVMAAGAYQNGTWVVGVAHGGYEEGVAMMGGSCIIAPSGMVVAEARTDGDEVITAACDLDDTRSYKEWVFNFEGHREPQHYWRITSQKGAVIPD